MKTVPAPESQYTVYPQQEKANNRQKDPLQMSAKELAVNKIGLPPVKPEVFDSPENWDESWFASYE